MSNRVQISSDSLSTYNDAVERGFGADVDYGQIVKTYGVVNLNKYAASRYSLAEVVKVEHTVVCGMPGVETITTSHIEKQNHTLRMHCRRLTRLTNAFSKKFEIFQAAVALNFAYYIFCKVHGAIRMTPAMAAALKRASGQWRTCSECAVNKEYIERLAMTIGQSHNCDCTFVESVPIHDVFRGQTVWQVRVEVFDLIRHPKAKKAYAWSHLDGANDEGERIVTVLEIPPVESPITAVRASIVAESKKGKK